jgi:hypothetical protein
MKIAKTVITITVLAASAAQFSRATELQAGTLVAWNTYLRDADLRMQQRIARRAPFLWTDEAPDRAARVSRGEVVIAPVVGHGTVGVPNGLVHDWIGAVFIPNATLESLWAVVHDYENYQHMYRPVVTSSRTLACTGGKQEFLMV